MKGCELTAAAAPPYQWQQRDAEKRAPARIPVRRLHFLEIANDSERRGGISPVHSDVNMNIVSLAVRNLL